MAEVVGFEPTDLSIDCFQDSCTRPLCDTSKLLLSYCFGNTINCTILSSLCQEYYSNPCQKTF